MNDENSPSLQELQATVARLVKLVDRQEAQLTQSHNRSTAQLEALLAQSHERDTQLLEALLAQSHRGETTTSEAPLARRPKRRNLAALLGILLLATLALAAVRIKGADLELHESPNDGPIGSPSYKLRLIGRADDGAGNPVDRAMQMQTITSGTSYRLGILDHANSERLSVTSTGKVGIVTTTPSAPLHVNGTTDTSLTSHGVLLTGPVTGPNLSIDQNEIMARDNGTASTLFLQADGGLVSIGAQSSTNLVMGSQSKIGIGTNSPNSKLEVTGGGIGVNRTVVVATGNIDISGSYLTNGADYAEYFPLAQPCAVHQVVSLDRNKRIRPAVKGDIFVLGIVSQKPSIIGNSALADRNPRAVKPIALLGRVKARVTGTVRFGDRLTLSTTPGVLVKAAAGEQVVAQSMESGSGVVEVLLK